MTLTARQQRFVAEYAVDLNGTQAAIRAGYSPVRAKVTASELLDKPEIAEMVAVTNRNVLAERQKTAADISRAAWDIIENHEEPASARVSALALEAKRFTEYIEKHEVDARVGVVLVRQTRGLHAGG